MKKILLSAVGGAPSVSIIKRLKANGYFVIGMDNSNDAVGRFFCDEFYQAPLISQTQEYLKFLATIDFDIFFPWLDEEHILFATQAINPTIYKKIVTSLPQNILIATNKIKTFEFAINNSIQVASQTNKAPAFVRAKFSRGSKNTYIEHDQKKLDTLNPNEFLVQEIIDGVEYTVDVLCAKDYFFAVPRKRLQAINVSLVGQIDMDTEIIDFCKNIIEKLEFFGPINIQIMRCHKTKKLYLIEINPRIAGTSILSIKGGFDILKLAIELFENRTIAHKIEVKNNLKMVRYWSEVFE